MSKSYRPPLQRSPRIKSIRNAKYSKHKPKPSRPFEHKPLLVSELDESDSNSPENVDELDEPSSDDNRQCQSRVADARSFWTDPAVRSAASRSARWLKKYPYFAHLDVEDLEHDLLIAIRQDWSAYDPSRSQIEDHMKVRADARAKDMLRKAKANKRRPKSQPRPMSLDATKVARGGESAKLRDVLAEDDDCLRNAGDSREHIDAIAIEFKVQQVIRELPERWQRVAVLMMKEKKKTEIARELNMPRTTLSGWVAKILERFKRRGLEQYIS